MSFNFKNSYFYLLPNEILIQILGHIDTFTLLSFCEVYDCDFFFQERDVIKYIDLPKKYLLDNLGLLSKKIVYEYVNTLNINCLYWIPVADLRKFVSKLVNLKVLYAIKTQLSITRIDLEIYNRTKIEKLGVTLRKNDDIEFYNAPNIKTLYINFVKTTSLLIPLTMEEYFPQLKNLWLDSEEPCDCYSIVTSLNPCGKSKIFCRINASTYYPTAHFLELRRYYNNRLYLCTMCYEKFNTADLNVSPKKEVAEKIRDAWNTLDELHCLLPFGPKDARRLFLNEATLYDISFQELNFHYTRPICLERCRQAQKEILKSKSAKTIKKLCIESCLLNNDGEKSNSKYEPSGFKRRRVDYHSAEEIFSNFPQLDHLEIFHCPQAYDATSIQAYPMIGKFPQLRTLILEIPPTLDGSFLTQVIKTCNKLECLKISSLKQNENLNHHLSNALPHACALADFRYENHRIPLDKLLERLCLIKSQKLQRLALICSEIGKFSAGPLKQFLDQNPQLTFLCFLIRQATENLLNMAQRTLNTYKKARPSRVYLAKKWEVGEIGYLIPDVHYYEIMKFDSTVATLRPLEDFLYF